MLWFGTLFHCISLSTCFWWCGAIFYNNNLRTAVTSYVKFCSLAFSGVNSGSPTCSLQKCWKCWIYLCYSVYHSYKALIQLVLYLSSRFKFPGEKGRGVMDLLISQQPFGHLAFHFSAFCVSIAAPTPEHHTQRWDLICIEMFFPALFIMWFRIGMLGIFLR